MLVVLGAIFGALLGARAAARKQGNRLDIIQFGAVYALLFALVGLFLTLAAGWLEIGYTG